MPDVRLEPLTAAHLDDMLALAVDPDTVRYTRVPDPMPDGWIESWIDTYEQARRDGTREAFAIAGGEGEFLGLAMAVHIDRPGRTVELGYVVAPAARGSGRRLTRARAADRLGVHRAGRAPDRAADRGLQRGLEARRVAAPRIATRARCGRST